MKQLYRILILLNVFIITFLLTSFSSAFEFKYRIVDDELKPFYTTYMSAVNSICKGKKFNNTDRFVIELVDDISGNDSWIGVCEYKLNGFNIKIAKGFWYSSSRDEQEQLMFHELAHCLIYREHEEKNDKHYMYPSFITLPQKIYRSQAIEDIKQFCK